jgi:hypothetical protein
MSPFWDVEESKGFSRIRSRQDNLIYKVWDKGSEQDQQKVAEVLARVRKDFNTLLFYLYKNKQLWIDRPIAYGIVHTFDIHVPYIYKLNGDEKNYSEILNKHCDFNIQEMTPNKDGIIGLNKPKIIEKKRINGKTYEQAKKRSIHLTIRNQITWEISNYQKILDLAIHEITHTTCNDIYWKEDNHLPPYQSYHTLMRRWSVE